MKIIKFTYCLTFFCLFAITLPVVADSEKDLVQVRKRIKSIEKEISRSALKRDKQQKQLAEAERLIARLQTNIARLNKERTESEARLKQLEADKKFQLEQLKAQKNELASLVYDAYVGGRQEKLKLFLSQKDPSELGRVAVYYRYLNEHRLEQIEAVNHSISELDQLSAQATLENQTIKQLQQQRHAELESLKDARIDRQRAIATLDSSIRNSTDRVGKLKAQELDLVKLIRELEQIMKDFPVGSRSSFLNLKGKLAWPLKGRLLADFGQSRNGSQIKWDGVLIGTERGSPVRAIARGRVAYADWLPGQGLLVIVEHGDNFFSLYGRNETVSTEPGNWVEAGQPIATAGDSGGQSQVALYFGLRKGGTAVNPGPWFKGSVSKR